MERVFNLSRPSALTGEARWARIDGDKLWAWVTEVERYNPLPAMAAAMGKVPDHHFAAAALYYRGESSYIPQIRLPLLERAIRMRKRNRWPRLFGKRPWVESLVNLAINEYADPGLSSLNGWHKRYGEHGEPLWSVMDTGGAEFVRVWWSPAIEASESQWTQTLSPRYEAVRGILDGWRANCIRRMHRALNDPAVELGVREAGRDLDLDPSREIQG